MVHRASRLGANLAQFAFVDAVGNDCLGGVLARLEFRPLCFFRRVGLLLPDLDVFVARDSFLSLRLLLVCRADQNKLRLGGVAIRVCALCGIWANSKSFLLAPGSRADRVGQQATQRTVSTGMSGRIPSSSEELL
jgi:hypothetical protein